MAESTVTIKLAGEEFTVKTPLRFQILKKFEPAFIRYGGQLVTAEQFEALSEAICLVLNDEDPNFTFQKLNEMRIQPQELFDAADALGIASGIMKKVEPVKEGETPVTVIGAGEAQKA